MSDITKCDGEGCSRKERCRRYTEDDAGKWQSWFTSPPGCEDGCSEFWPVLTAAAPSGAGDEEEGR